MTRQNQSEESLRAWGYSAERAGWGMAMIDRESRRITLCNAAYVQMHGYSRDELLRLTLESLHTPEDRAAAMGNIKLLDRIGHLAYKSTRLRKDGSTFPAMIDLSLAETDGRTFVIANMRDISLEWAPSSPADQTRLYAAARDVTDRHMAEEALRESRDFAVSILDSLGEHIAVLDENGLITAVNQKWRRFAAENGKSDLDPSISVGGNYFAACDLPPGDPDSASAAAAKAGILSVLSGSRESFTLEYPCHSPFEQRWFEMRVSRLQSLRPSVVVAHKNITARIHSDAAIRLRDVALAASATAMLTTNRHGVIVWANQAFSELSGYAIDEVVGRTPGALSNSGKHDLVVYQDLWRTIISGAVWRGELVNRRKDGSLYHEQQTITPVRDESGAISQFIAVKQDISERKALEADLCDSEERYRSLVSATLDALLLTTLEGGILGANEAACRMFGYSEADLIRNGRAAIEDLTDPRLKPAMEARDRTGRFHGELRFLRADGSRFEGEVTSAVFHNGCGEARTSLVIRDVTERRQAEARLRRSEAQLHALTARLQAVREEERTRIARDVHDVLGQQLTGLTLDMAWLQKRLRHECGPCLQDSIVEKFVEIRQLTDQMIQTVQEIASDMRPSVLDNLGLSSAIRFESGRFQKRTGIACQVEIMATAPVLAPERSTGVFRIFQEILTNIARHAGATQVHIRLNVAEQRLLLVVRDNGRGITPGQLADSASLGLLGMRERAGQIGGEIRFVGEPGRGTTVSVALSP